MWKWIPLIVFRSSSPAVVSLLDGNNTALNAKAKFQYFIMCRPVNCPVQIWKKLIYWQSWQATQCLSWDNKQRLACFFGLFEPYVNHNRPGLSCIHHLFLFKYKRKKKYVVIFLACCLLCPKQGSLNRLQHGNSSVQMAAALLYLHNKILNPICTSEHSVWRLHHKYQYIHAFGISIILLSRQRKGPRLLQNLECGCCLERLALHVWRKKKAAVLDKSSSLPNSDLSQVAGLFAALSYVRGSGEWEEKRDGEAVRSDLGGKFSSISCCFRTLSCTGPQSSSSPLLGFRTSEQKFHLHGNTVKRKIPVLDSIFLLGVGVVAMLVWNYAASALM